MHFVNDIITSVCPEIMAALVACSEGVAASYGAEEYTQRLNAMFTQVFETEVAVFLS
jgi:threonine aldolase